MAQYFRISPAYWAKLSDKEKYFLQVNACDYGERNCKRVLTLANKFFPGWGEIDNAADLLRANGHAKMAVLAINTWSVMNDAGRPVGMIYKGENIGLCERVYFADETGKYIEIYNDITGIKKSLQNQYKTAILSLYGGKIPATL